MAITEAFAGSGTIASTQVVSLTTPTGVGPDVNNATGVYQVFIDFVNQTGLVEHELKVWDKVNNGPQRTIYIANIIGPQNPPIFVTPSLILGNWDITLQRISGTDTNIGWSIRKIA